MQVLTQLYQAAPDNTDVIPKELMPMVYEKLYRYLVAESLAMKSRVILEKTVPLVKAFDTAAKETETSKLEMDKSFTRLQTRITHQLRGVTP